MKKTLLALMLVAASLNVAACASRQATTTTEDSSMSEMQDRTTQAQNAANDSLRK